MTGWEFWVAALCLGLGAALVLLRAMARAGEGKAAGSADLAVYKDQLAEIARDLARGTLGPEEAERLRTEISRRVLEADRALAQRTTMAKTLPILTAPILILTFALPGALALYGALGAPGYPDMALKPRLQALDEGIASRPGQAEELQRLGLGRDAGLDATLATELAAISDATALRALFRQRLESGEIQAAIRTMERLMTQLGPQTDAADHANLALALVVEAQGYVSPEAETHLRETLTRDMGNELARYLVGEMFLQGGRYDQAFNFWRPIAEGGSGAPWVPKIRDEIEALAELAGIRYTLPEAAPGPSSEDMAAAAEMPPEDQQAMIEGMVAQLSDRLATEGGTVEDWNRLIRALVVLDRKVEAQSIYDEAKKTFADQAAELSFLKLAAVESGLAP